MSAVSVWFCCTSSTNLTVLLQVILLIGAAVSYIDKSAVYARSSLVV